MNINRKLLDCEWTILRTLWNKHPLGMKDIIEHVKETQPEIKWSYKTYHTYLSIMLEKGLIGCNIISSRDKRYFPVITREEALEVESKSLLTRISMDSLGRLVAMMAKDGQILEKDRQDLIALFSELNEKTGEQNVR